MFPEQPGCVSDQLVPDDIASYRAPQAMKSTRTGDEEDQANAIVNPQRTSQESAHSQFLWSVVANANDTRDLRYFFNNSSLKNRTRNFGYVAMTLFLT